MLPENPGQRDVDEKISNAPGRALNELEGDSDTSKVSDVDNINAAENSVPETPSWATNVSRPDQKGSLGKGGAKAFLKKNGSSIAISSLVLGTGAIISFITSSALLPMSVLARLVEKFNTQETSLSIRADKILISKLAKDVTNGDCLITKIACRFSRPSNRLLKNFEKNGIKALDEDGNVISKTKGLWPNKKPDSLMFTEELENGEKKIISATADKLKGALKDNPAFRSALRKSANPRWYSVTGKVFDAIQKKFGFGLNNEKAAKVKNDEEFDKKVSDESAEKSNLDDDIKADVKNADDVADDATEPIDDALAKKEEAAVKDIITETAQKEGDELIKSSKGNAVGLAAGIACFASDAPKIITTAARTYQMKQLIKYSMLFLTAFGSIKASDAKPELSTAIGTALTKLDKNNKSAMDSFGMNYVMNDQKKPSSSDNYKKFVPGGSVMSKLSGVLKVTDSDTRKEACRYATNPITGEIISGSSPVAALVNIVVGCTVGEILKRVLPDVIAAVMQHVPIKKILSFFMGDLTKDLVGEDVGNALASGASHVMGQTGNAGGNMPLSTKQAVAYANTTKQVQLAYAEEDRATKSPFDINSPNTMLGSMVQKMLPYFMSSSYSMGSVSNTIGAINRIVVGSFGIALNPLAANAESAAVESDYQLCEDPTIKERGVATGPYCNIIYGVPPEYLDKDPNTVLSELGDGNVDPDTGEPISGSDLAKWVEHCTDGTADKAGDCVVKDNDQTRANYALYTIDHRIQQSMDDEDSSSSTSTSSDGTADPGDASQPPNTIPAGKGWNLKEENDYSGVPCASGTTDSGTYKHPKNGYTIQKCKVAGVDVASLISQRTLNMVKAAADSDVSLTGKSGFRTYEEQQAAWIRNGCDKKGVDCSGLVAVPGDSMHERGLAIDFNDIAKVGSGPKFDWLTAYAKNYGFYNLSTEGWHWSMSGG